MTDGGTGGIRPVWLSGAFGYTGELLYFEQIFAELHRRFPAAVVPVDRAFPVDRYPGLPLLPTLKFHILGKVERKLGEIVYTSLKRLPTLGSLWRLHRLGPDVLIVTEFSRTALAGFAMARLTRTPVALLVESDPTFRGAPNSRFSLAVKRFVSRRVNAILVSNEAGLSYLTDTVGAPAEKILVGPYLTSDPAATAVPLERGDDRVRLLFLNSVNARKGLRELIEALARAPVELRGRWCLDVVGDGPERATVEARAAELGLAENCVFHGKADFADIGGYYLAADLVVCPTLADYRSLSGFEAVNAGKPVLISVYDGASRELAEFAPAARPIDPRNTAELATTLTRYLADPEFLRSEQEAAARRPTRFLVSSVGDNLERLVRRALGQRSA